MTWPDVAADAIKIGVPSLLTGGVAFFLARASRSHELEKERRRRKQDVLQTTAEYLDVIDIKLTNFDAAQGALDIGNEEDAPEETEAIYSTLLDAIRAIDDADERFGLVKTKLFLCGFTDCSRRFEENRDAITNLKTQLAKVIQTKADATSLGPPRQEWLRTCAALRAELATAFATL